jgi:glycosyltransferase involved in cell wall biosynthesis
MKLSFIIPAYNEEKVIAKCILSVQQEISRNHFDTEIIVVNNNCTDKTKEIALSFNGVRVVDEVNKGLVFARKCGMDNSDGELIANIDADVMVPKGWLKKVMGEFEKDKNLVALSGPYIYYDLSILQRAWVRIFYYLGYSMYIFNSKVLKISGMLQGGNFIVRRDAMKKIGGYDTRISFYGEDTDIAKRIFKVGRVKWTFDLPMYTTGRRLKEEGLITMGLKYAINHIWPIFFSKPFTEKYVDIRE